MSVVLSVSSSRADVGALAPIWRALADMPGIDLRVLLTGMHIVDDKVARAALPSGVTTYTRGADLGGATPAVAAAAMARIEADTAALLAEVRPDLVLIMGDRLDMLPAASATLPFNLPLVHLHGGEVTEGAIDDRIRHALTKLSHVHCVSTPGARARLLAMGEDDSRIHVTGAPGLDTLKAIPAMSAEAFAAEAGLSIAKSDLAALRLVTVHPETNAAAPLLTLDAVLRALEMRPAATLFTAPNSDPGGEEIRHRIDVFVAQNPWARFRDTLGARLYANALRHVAVMVGNSSSGIIEAGLFGLPVINVGDRQRGRERGANVVDVANDADAVVRAMDRLGAVPARLGSSSPYGDGEAASRIAHVIGDALRMPGLTGKPAIASRRLQEESAHAV